MSQFATEPAARFWLTAAFAAAGILSTRAICAQPSSTAGPGSGRHVVAHVDDQEILRAEVDRALAGVPPIAGETAKAQRFRLATRLMVERAIALDYLAARKLGATNAEIDLALRDGESSWSSVVRQTWSSICSPVWTKLPCAANSPGPSAGNATPSATSMKSQ